MPRRFGRIYDCDDRFILCLLAILQTSVALSLLPSSLPLIAPSTGPIVDSNIDEIKRQVSEEACAFHLLLLLIQDAPSSPSLYPLDPLKQLRKISNSTKDVLVQTRPSPSTTTPRPTTCMNKEPSKEDPLVRLRRLQGLTQGGPDRMDKDSSSLISSFMLSGTTVSGLEGKSLTAGVMVSIIICLKTT